jgi:putative N6-adenine-specific DNA methylase
MCVCMYVCIYICICKCICVCVYIGLRRAFASESWRLVCDASDWERVRSAAEKRVIAAPKGLRIFGADIDRRAVEMTYAHLSAAGLQHAAQLSVSDIHRLQPPPGEDGSIVTNPPYGERLGEALSY